MKELTVISGYSKNGCREPFESISFHLGELWAIVGPTGAGKSRFIKDIEMLVSGDSVTKRRILIDGEIPALASGDSLIAHLGQNMRFVLDLNVNEFLSFHREANRKVDVDLKRIIETASLLSGESFSADSRLSELSGGQSRALMVADIAYLSDRPIVLIDEIENAGIDKVRALRLLVKEGKLVLLVTHDPHTALSADRRIAIADGAVVSVRRRSTEEEKVFKRLDAEYKEQQRLKERMRRGEEVV